MRYIIILFLYSFINAYAEEAETTASGDLKQCSSSTTSILCPRAQSLLFGSPGLDISLNRSLDISSLGISAGGLAFDPVSENIWLSDSIDDMNTVTEIDPLTGATLSQLNASIVPGLALGPDGLALDPATGNLFLFSVFFEDIAGEITQDGTLVRTFPSGNNSASATFLPSGELILVDEDNGDIFQTNPITGMVESTVPLDPDFTTRIGAASFDPLTGNLFAFSDSLNSLLEIDLNTGDVLSTTDMSAFIPSANFASGLAFNASGSILFLANSSIDELLVFDRPTGAIPAPSLPPIAVPALNSISVFFLMLMVFCIAAINYRPSKQTS